ncbi:MAG: aspartate aminotransferase [Halobacteriovoraceae bacterium]|nr:aspartate aminotransferase [Halobacteriovoraceae bacterium]|tara:strand:- start:3478 stop:4671 length:1194 start_codon:yes stop_codon:yes gene_type:complete
MSIIARRILNMEESATLKMANLAWELKDQGKDVISLSLGEPDFNTPQFVKDAAIEAIHNDFTHYPPVPGYKDVRQSICEKFKRDNGLEFTPEQIVISTGAKHSLMNICLALVNPGEEVILPAPYWVSYHAMASFAEAKIVEIKTGIENDFKITPEQLEEALTENSKLFIFSNPCNPSGSVYSKDELIALAQVFEKYPKCYIVSDEIYEHINFDDECFSIGTVESIKDRVITVNGVAKGFAMTGWRIGYLGASKEVASACTKLQGQFTSGANTIAQKATAAAVQADPKKIEEMKQTFLKRRDLVIELLKSIEGLGVNIPKGAFYVFPDVSSYLGKSVNGQTIKTADDLCMYLLEDGLVATTSGESFGCPQNIRISYANSEEQLKEAIKRLKNSLAKLS